MLPCPTHLLLRFTCQFFSFPGISRGKLDWEVLAWETQKKLLDSEKVTHLQHTQHNMHSTLLVHLTHDPDYLQCLQNVAQQLDSSSSSAHKT